MQVCYCAVCVCLRYGERGGVGRVHLPLPPPFVSTGVRSGRWTIVFRSALHLNSPTECAAAPAAAPRAGEIVALEAYERIVRKALADGESDAQLADRLKTAGIAGEQAAAAAAAYESRLPEMRARMVEAASQVSKSFKKMGRRRCCACARAHQKLQISVHAQAQTKG